MSSSEVKQIDLELKKAFQELQSKMVTTQQQLKISDMQIESLKRQVTHSRLVDTEVSALPKNTRVYEGVGRMFILQDIDSVKKNLSKKVSTCEDKIKTIQGSKEYLKRTMAESEHSLRELVVSRQKAMK